VTNAPLSPADAPGGNRPGRTSTGPGARLSIGALSRATGIPIETLRTWETRYGFPDPERKPSGHRAYRAAAVPRLRRIAAALARGHRASECVAASDDDLDALIGLSPEHASSRPGDPLPVAGEDTETMLVAVTSFDDDRLTRMLLGEWARLGPMEFLAQRIGPLITRVGEEWGAGRLQVTHEHFLSERLTDVLRTLRAPFESRADGPLIVCATLPGERHGLGLQMAALVAAVAGWRVLYLGTEVPPEQIASTVAETGARAVAVSVSRATAGPSTTMGLAGVRRDLPERVPLFVGGEGAPGELPGVDTVGDFDRFRDRLGTLATN
jgi:methanogenic corrinoid protein MtbC1